MNEQLMSLMKNKEFVEKMLKCKKAAEVQALFAEYGCELTLEEVNSLCKQLKSTFQKALENGGELSENDLEDVAGGFAPLFIPFIAWGTAKTFLVALGVGTGVSATTILTTGVLSDWEW